MSIFYDTKNTETIQPYESLAKGKRTDFEKNFTAGWDAFLKTEMILSEINNLDEAYGNMNEILTKAGHTNFISPTDPSNYMVDDTEVPPSRRSLEEAYWKQIAEVSAQDENLKNLFFCLWLNFRMVVLFLCFLYRKIYSLLYIRL